MTNCWPMMRIAWVTAWRITGSPERVTSRRSTAHQSSSGPAWSRVTIRPVSISAQVEALTNTESECPRWRCQSAPPILSLISRSAVSASGMRNSASARHMSTTPSSLASWYSCRKASMPPARRRASRTERTSRAAVASIRASSSGASAACARRSTTQRLSSMQWASRMAARSGPGSGGLVSNSIMGQPGGFSRWRPHRIPDRRKLFAAIPGRAAHSLG